MPTEPIPAPIRAAAEWLADSCAATPRGFPPGWSRDQVVRDFAWAVLAVIEQWPPRRTFRFPIRGELPDHGVLSISAERVAFLPERGEDRVLWPPETWRDRPPLL
jgi:hypothetical protein